MSKGNKDSSNNEYQKPFLVKASVGKLFKNVTTPKVDGPSYTMAEGSGGVPCGPIGGMGIATGTKACCA